MRLSEDIALIEAMVQQLGADKPFGLRAFPGEEFVVSISASFFSGDEMLLYVFKKDGDAFSKGSPAELRREMVKLS